MRFIGTAIALVAVAACTPRPESSGLAAPAIRITEDGGGARVVDVVGLPAEDLTAIRDASPTSEEWNSMLRVTVESGTEDLPAVAGSYEVANGTLRFVPAFPLDPRVAHRVVFDPTRLPRRLGSAATEPWRSQPTELAIAATAHQAPPTTRVTQVFPNDILLENQLRIYIHFSAPMGTQRTNDDVHLRNDEGDVVEDAFLPLDVGLWNAERTRYTLLFDPGRVKRGILPNREMGRPLESGRRYTLVVDRAWRDAQGQQLAETFQREFHVVPGVFEPIVPAEWHLEAPPAGTREPLSVAFPRPLDHAIVKRALFVAEADGHLLDGATAVNDASTQWTFVPRSGWNSGEYVLGTLAILEDPAGNRVGRAFDFDLRQVQNGTDDGDAHAQAAIPFTVLPAAPGR